MPRRAKAQQIYRVRTDKLAPYEDIDITIWGESGARENPGSTNPHDVQQYYIRLAVHMANGGDIKPLEVGYEKWQSAGPDDQVYVFNGNHRLLIARALGLKYLPVINSACEDAIPLDEDELRKLGEHGSHP